MSNISHSNSKKPRYDSEGGSVYSSSSDDSDVEITSVFRPYGYYADDKPDSLPGSSSESDAVEGVESSNESNQGTGSAHASTDSSPSG